jgi:hypothetical protein
VSWRRRVVIGVATAAGVAAGILATLAFDDPGPTAAPPVMTRATDPPRQISAPAPAIDEPDVLLVWTSGGLPSGLAAAVADLDGVDLVTAVGGDETAMVGSRDERGVEVDRHMDGWRIPLDTLAVDPSTFARFVPDADADAVGALGPGEALLTTSSAELRRVGTGGTIQLEGGEVAVVGIIEDLSGAGAELIVTAADAARLGVTTERYLLVQHEAERATLERTIAERLLDGRATRFRAATETTWLRHGDAVQPNLAMKLAFGEFAYRDGPGRTVEIDPAWVERSIITDEVPVLGAVTCHREVIEPLAAALQELSDLTLGHLVDPADFAGCYSPRRIAAGQPLSHHAWGAAVDLNVDGNPRGSFSTQDERLVEVMLHHGFTWGGTWLVPDPAHYEAPLG